MNAHVGHDHWKAQHYVFRDGVWRGYASKWKSRQPQAAVYVRGTTITDIQRAIRARELR